MFSRFRSRSLFVIVLLFFSFFFFEEKKKKRIEKHFYAQITYKQIKNNILIPFNLVSFVSNKNVNLIENDFKESKCVNDILGMGATRE